MNCITPHNNTRMSKKKHLLDWYIENTPSNEKEYDNAFVGAFIIVAIVFIALGTGIYFIGA